MAVNLAEEYHKATLARTAEEEANLLNKQRKLALMDTLYESSPTAGFEYAKKIGALPPGAQLSTVNVEGIDLPAAFIPGLDKPIVLPKSGQQFQKASALQTQASAARAQTEELKAASRFEREKYITERQREITTLRETLAANGKLTVQAQRHLDRLDELAFVAKATSDRDDKKQEFDFELAQFKTDAASALASQKAESSMVEVRATIASREKIAAQQDSTKVFMQNRGIEAKKQAQTTALAAQAMRQSERLAAQAEIANKRLEEKKAGLLANSRFPGIIGASSTQRISPKSVSPAQLNQTLDLLDDVFDARDIDTDDFATTESIASSFAEATNLINAIDKQYGVSSRPTEVLQALIKTAKKTSSDFWVLDADSGKYTLSQEAISRFIQNYHDNLSTKSTLQKARSLYPKETVDMSDDELRDFIEAKIAAKAGKP